MIILLRSRVNPLMNTNSLPLAVLTFDTAVYRLTALKKAAYRLSGRCAVTIDLVGDRTATLSLHCPDSSADLQDLIREVHREVTDQELREVVLAETAGIRNLLLAQAFSATSLIDPEEETIDYRLDPMGIRPSDDEARPDESP